MGSLKKISLGCICQAYGFSQIEASRLLSIMERQYAHVLCSIHQEASKPYSDMGAQKICDYIMEKLNGSAASGNQPGYYGFSENDEENVFPGSYYELLREAFEESGKLIYKYIGSPYPVQHPASLHETVFSAIFYTSYVDKEESVLSLYHQGKRVKYSIVGRLTEQEEQNIIRNRLTQRPSLITIAAWKTAIDEYKKCSGLRQNDALPERMTILLRHLSGETNADLSVAYPGKNISRTLADAKEKDVPKLKKLYFELGDLY